MPAVTVTRPCASIECQNEHTRRSPFCSDFCRAAPEFVRMCRKWITNLDKQADPGYDDAFYMALSKLTEGYLAEYHGVDGWRRKNPRPPDSVIAYVRERDNNTCQRCSKPGDEIDHIHGPSVDPENLQILCRDCNLAKAAERMKLASPMNRLILSGFIKTLAKRIEATTPLSSCDDEQNWGSVWRKWPDIPAVVYSPQVASMGFADIQTRVAIARARLSCKGPDAR